MDQVADIGMARVHRQLVALLDHLAHAVDVGEVQLRVDALGVHVQRHGDQVDVAGALAVAEQAAFHAVGAGHQAQLGGGHAGAAVVVGVQADQHAVAAVDVAAEPLDLVGVDVRRGRLDGRRQVEDQLLLRGRLEHADHRVAHLDGEGRLGGAEHLGRVLEAPVGFRVLRGLALDDLRRVDGDLGHPGLVLMEDDLAKARRGGVVVVDDGLLGALERLEGAHDQVFAGLGEHLDGGVVGNVAALDQGAHEVEVGLRGGREAHFDFLDAALHQDLEHAQLLVGIHRLDQRLVAVAQVGAQPDRRLGDGLRRPGAIGNVDLREGAVLLRRIFEHGHGEFLETVAAGRRAKRGERRRVSQAVAGIAAAG
ncbi:hypothetical protein D3C81_810330 [compost metagenome]